MAVWNRVNNYVRRGEKWYHCRGSLARDDAGKGKRLLRGPSDLSTRLHLHGEGQLLNQQRNGLGFHRGENSLHFRHADTKNESTLKLPKWTYNPSLAVFFFSST